MRALKEVRPLKALLFGFVIAALIVFVAPRALGSDTNDPGSGCNGQAAPGPDCRPDPQPTNGQDCEAHGNNPDGNEDHCGPTPTPTTPPTVEPTPSPTVPPTVTPTPHVDPTPETYVTPTRHSHSHTPRLAKTGITLTLALIGIGILLLGFVLLMVPLMTMDATKRR